MIEALRLLLAVLATVSPGTDELEARATLQEAPARVWDVSGSEPTIFPHEPLLEAPEGAFLVRWRTTGGGRQGLVSKDHNGFGSGGHFSVWLEDGALLARMQGDSLEATELSTGPMGSGLADGSEHEAVVTWGPDGTDVYIDGAHLGSFTWSRGLEGNQQPIAAGAMIWSSTPGTADSVSSPLAGDLTALEFYDEVYTPEASGDTVRLQVTGTAFWSAVTDDQELAGYRWTVRPTAGWSGAADTVLAQAEVGVGEPRQASFALPFDPDGSVYTATFCIRAVDAAGQESSANCVAMGVPARPVVDQPPPPPDTVEASVRIDTIMAMAPERGRAWIFARWHPGDGVAWYRTLVRDAVSGDVVAWRNENNWGGHYPWGATGFYLPRRASSYTAELVLEGYPSVHRVEDYRAFPPPLEELERAVYRWQVPAAGPCRDYRGRPMDCRG